MAVTYKWVISQMNAYIEEEGKDNVIFAVHYNYEGSEESNGVIYHDNTMGIQNFQYTAGDTFVPYADTEAFEAIVIKWLEGSLDVPAMQASIATTIATEIAPVNEDLYFTWMNPVPPVPPVDED